MGSRSRTIVIGAAGAVGKRLCAALRMAGSEVIAADRLTHMPSTVRNVASAYVGEVDVRSTEALDNLMRDHANEDTTVWNLAAPLSVETAMSPEVAQQIVIGGMKNTLSAMAKVGARRICFTDSIGSFGATSPRNSVSARWLHENPTQDPGSDYGVQKRAVRELLNEFHAKQNGDPRIAILPGVLHSAPVWGNGTTEYALDALLAASRDRPYECPIEKDTQMPMVFVDDLMRGLVALQFAKEEELREPERLYAIPGLSFSPEELFKEIRHFKPDFKASYGPYNANMVKFSKLWPDTLSTVEAERDLDYVPDVNLPRIVASVLNEHSSRRFSNKAAFRSIDVCNSGNIKPETLRKFVRKNLVRGREQYEYDVRRQDLVAEIVDQAMAQMDVDKSGTVSMEEFMEWSRTNDLESLVDDYADKFYNKQEPAAASA
mmetsp:Transcript_2157/g.7524  ORF Transcript_2157/g.7524 Transcript_2157/m.7524 type:complete len:432 (+) Transcript_2157:142-1437(+)